MKILNVDLYTQTLLWFVTSCATLLEVFSLFGSKSNLLPNETISSTPFVQLVTIHNQLHFHN